MKQNKRILLVDLNNEAPFPTLAIGYLATPLIAAGYEVKVFTPLTHSLKPVVRDVEETLLNYLITRVRFATHPMIEWANEAIYSLYTKFRFKPTKRFREETLETINKANADIVLVSSYLQYRAMFEEIAEQAHKEGLKLLLGGPFFNVPEVVQEWIGVEGVTAIFGGEPEFVLENLVGDMLADRDISLYPGVFTNTHKLAGQAAPPLQQLDRLPVPNFDYYQWPNEHARVLPVMAGRGCGWGKCLFCSDVITASTRTFRTRHLDSVLAEMKHQSKQHNTRNFIFFDSKLNSDLPFWYGLIDHLQSEIPGAHWVATVHVDGKGDNGLDAETLQKAANAGLRRMSFGLETGSQKLNNSMLKGTKIERTSAFINNARAAGISVRTTIMLGYPGESEKDIRQTIEFIQDHREALDRVHLSRFKAIPGTGFNHRLNTKPHRYVSLKNLRWDFAFARAKYRYQPEHPRAYRQAKNALIKLVHEVNKKPLLDTAQQFNGMM